MSIFSRDEYDGRVGRVRQRMLGAGVDVLLVSSPENINYLTGYSGWSFYTPQLAIVSHGFREPLLITRLMDKACAEFSTYLSPDNLIGYPEDLIGDNNRHPMQFMAELIKERGWTRAVLGVEKNAHFFSIRAYEILTSQLSEARFVDADLLVDAERLIKSDAEIEVMRQAGLLAGKAMQGAVERIAPGVRECDAAAALYAAQLSGTPQFGGGVPNSVLMSAGERARAPHLKWSDRTFVENESVAIELSGCRHQYHAGLARTVYLGKPSPGLLRVTAVVLEGMAEVLEQVKPGVPCEKLVETWQCSIGKAGYRKASRIGYSIGLCFQPTWLERTVSLQSGEQTNLATNMCFHLMCGMWEDADHLVMSETFRVAEEGVELLTKYPRELIVK